MISSSKLLKDKDNKKNLLDLNRNSKRCQKSAQKPPTPITSQPNALLALTYNILCRTKICLCRKKLIDLSGNGSLILCIILKFEENPSKEGYKSQSQVYIISLLSLPEAFAFLELFSLFPTSHSVSRLGFKREIQLLWSKQPPTTATDISQK